ncbi:MAG TPA: AAA family ATPase [Actinokineospora sp.]|nr:AAA family ATPase [Actinokineospora sp.]
MHLRSSHLVGRDGEVTRLSRATDGARAGRGTTVFIVGEPGVGKTRLAMHTAAAAAGRGTRVLRGRGSAVGPIVPFRPLAEALMSLFRGDGKPDGTALGPYRAALGILIPEWGEPDSIRASVVVLAEAVLRLISDIGAGDGCLFVLDDLQEADAETLAVVEYLLDNLDDQPVTLVATIRDEPSAALDLARNAARRGAAEIIELGGISRAEVELLAASCLEADPGDLPTAALDHLWHNSAGIPFVVEELLQAMLADAQLTHTGGGWRMVGTPRADLPVALVRSLAGRTDRLGPQGRSVLSVAAVIGRRFPLSVLQRVTAIDDRSLLSHLHAGVEAHLIAPDDTAPGWYAFRHPLTAEALLVGLTPGERADICGRAADAVQEGYPGLPGEWCQVVATLRQTAGDTAAAVRLFTEAGCRALADGAATSAVALLEQAERLLRTAADPGLRADVLVALLPALAEAGQFDRALQWADTLDHVGGDDLDAARGAELHTRLAKVAYLAGRWADGAAAVAAARALLGPAATDEQTAPVDVIAAYLALDMPGQDRMAVAEDLARRAESAARRSGLPMVECDAWQVRGIVARERDLDEAKACFERVLSLARQHSLPMYRVYGLYRLGINDWLAEGDTRGLDRAREHAVRVGVVTMVYVIDSVLALHSVLRAEFADATERVEQCWATVSRLRLAATCRYVQATKAVLAAHQGRRRYMEAALAEFRSLGGELAAQQVLAVGMARVLCALLEEDPAASRRDLTAVRAFEVENPTTFYLSGTHGLELLLDVLALLDAGQRTQAWERYRVISAQSVSRMRWNRQFVLLAHAALLGAGGRTDDADAAMSAAEQAAEIYPMARHLGLRLVAPPAHADGWGDPVGWLRRAEEYFHQAQVPAVASACRAMLRQFGASVQQRRDGTGRVPAVLREHGVSAREFDVFELLRERMGNDAIATRLHISPRTVEKHVASLITKTLQPDRAALSRYAGTVLST